MEKEMKNKKPILFSTAMVQAILEGRKTQTRRIVKPQPKDCFSTHQAADDLCEWKDKPMTLIQDCTSNEWHCKYCGNGIVPTGHSVFKCPYGKVGDILWVRETFRPVNRVNSVSFQKVGSQYDYRADYKEAIKGHDRFKPSIHMPFSACRLFLRVKTIRVERLQEISEQDAITEGVKPMKFDSKIFRPYDGYKNYYIQDGEDKEVLRTARESFQSLWSAINGYESWNDNPYVWVIEFERTEKP